MRSSEQDSQQSPPSEPQPLIGLAALMRQAFAGNDLAPLGKALIERAELDPADGNALLDLSTVLQLRGERDTAMATQMEAFRVQSVYRVPSSNPDSSLRVLALMAPGDLMANSPVEFLLEDSDIRLDLLYVGHGLAEPVEIPEHDLLFVAVAQSERNAPLLAALARLFEDWPRPVVNRPEFIARLSRDGVCDLLREVPAIQVPESKRVDRGALERIAESGSSLAELLGGADFPIIVRPVDSHAGHGLKRLDHAGEVAAYLREEVSHQFFASRFVDYRSHDGLFRKYRIMLIGGRPYLCHMAISDHWMIHYLNAGMTESFEKRAEEARVMTSFDEDFAKRHGAALSQIHDRCGLEYFGIDCAETPDGRLLVFEVDSCMIVHAMDPVDLFPYKQPQMRKLFGAFRDMLLRISGAPSRAQP